MPKLKTHKGAAARFRITGTGKLRRMKGHRSHFRRKKTPSGLRQLARKQAVSSADAPTVRRRLPYGLP